MSNALSMGCSRSSVAATLVVLSTAVGHVLIAPYTKIEERFILNAVHDTLVAPTAAEWDYRQFPDPVPHSFAGVHALSLVSLPFNLVARSSAQVELAVRLTLALINTGALVYLFHALSQGPLALLLTSAQFHFLFWAGRTTHNAVVLGPVLVAFRLVFVDRRPPRAAWGIAVLTFCAALLRSELVGLLAPATLWVLFTGLLSIPRVFLTGLCAGLAALVWGTLVDRPAWKGIHEPSLPLGLFLPEWEAIVFNIVHGKSKKWGVMPLHWYGTRALPKLLTLSLPLALLGGVLLLKDILRSTVRSSLRAFLGFPLCGLVATASFHVGLLSLVAHKEWRFIIYTVPIWNLVAARALDAIWSSKPRALVQKDKPLSSNGEMARLYVQRGTVLLVLALTSGLTMISIGASRHNYPGGQALALLHQNVHGSPAYNTFAFTPSHNHVHLDVAATTTGATLFQNLHMERASASGCTGAFGSCWLPEALPAPMEKWVYNHVEDLPTGSSVDSANEEVDRWAQFTHLVTDALDCRPIGNLTIPLARSKHADGNRADVQVGFVPLGHPVRTFAGLRRLGLRTYLARVWDVLCCDNMAVENLVPVSFEMVDALRLCSRQIDSA